MDRNQATPTLRPTQPTSLKAGASRLAELRIARKAIGGNLGQVVSRACALLLRGMGKHRLAGTRRKGAVKSAVREFKTTKALCGRCRSIFDFEKNSSKFLYRLYLRLNSRGPVCAPLVTTVRAESQAVALKSFTIADRCDRPVPICHNDPLTGPAKVLLRSDLWIKPACC
jgi:hypothetical protein